MRRSHVPVALVALLGIGAGAYYLWPSTSSTAGTPDVPLGTISFPTSGSPAAQTHFLRGVLWLHSFEYEEAIDAFREAQRRDPSFAMAYWGEALAFSQPLWLHDDPEAARAVLARLGPTPEARAAQAPTPREQGYLRAVESLYGPGNKASRDRAYADAMAALVEAFPEDDEAHAFYALSLLAMLPRGDASLPLREKAGAIAEGVFERNPSHPGAAHYVLHAYDHGALAARALQAARVYARIAPASSHALHMPAHAFIQLGYWEEAAATDQASWNASIAWAARRQLSVAMRDFHSLSWLQYHWTQLGRFEDASKALRWVDEARAVVRPTDHAAGHHDADSTIGRGTGPDALRNHRGSMRARYVIESERWGEMRGQTTFDNIDELFALGMAAVKMDDLPRASAAIEMLQDAAAREPALGEQAVIMILELAALLELANGREAAAFQAIQDAVVLQNQMPKPIGRPYPVKGADELYGELLLHVGRPREAMVWFERALQRTPNRSRAVLGLARAAAGAGEADTSRTHYERFLENWKAADPGLPEVEEARKAVASR